MKKYSTAIALALLVAVPFLFSFNHSHADLASAFLKTLSKEQRKRAQMDFDDMSRVNWTFLPGLMIAHDGISMSELDDNQKKHVHEMLKAYLSEKGYDKTKQIIALEDVLFELEDGNEMRDHDAYVIGIYGEPEDTGVWGWCFQGHHVSLNFTIVNNELSMTPRFLGTNPAEVKSGPKKGLRVLHVEEDLGFELVNMLSKEQLKTAMISPGAFIEIVSATATEMGPLAEFGIAYHEMTTEQQQLLVHLIAEYLSTMPTELAATRMGLIEEEGMSNVHFGWAGALKLGKAHYYRIQGATFLIEFDNTQNNANHVHTVWRDFKGDFGRDLLREHYEHGHQR